jgi:uncharacterized protein with ATP-grasp and redox domains
VQFSKAYATIRPKKEACVHIKPDCINCLLNQALKVTKLLELDDRTSKKILDESAKILIAHSLEDTPPQIAKDIYRTIAEITGLEDPVAMAKERATKEAMAIDTTFVETIGDALKLSVIGNVIDFGAQNQFDLQETIEHYFSVPFAEDESERFLADLEEAKELVIIGDNTGEHIIDRLLIEKIRERFDLEIYYFVRGVPIINDVTAKEAAYLSDVATVVDTGVATPGYDLAEANAYSRAIFDRADVVLAKGMGNFESLYGLVDREVYYLFIVKCTVVAEAIGRSVKDMVLLREG